MLYILYIGIIKGSSCSLDLHLPIYAFSAYHYLSCEF